MPIESTSYRRREHERLARPGTVFFALGAIVMFLRGIEATYGISGMPRFWHQNQPIWIGMGMVSLLAGWRMLVLAGPREERAPAWKPAIPGRRFRQLVLFTRANCSLCEEAAEILAEHSHWIPIAQEVDIDLDPQLIQNYGTCVPVVSFDGKVRFRGRVDETLLHRLIEGTPPQPAGRIR